MSWPMDAHSYIGYIMLYPVTLPVSTLTSRPRCDPRAILRITFPSEYMRGLSLHAEKVQAELFHVLST